MIRLAVTSFITDSWTNADISKIRQAMPLKMEVHYFTIISEFIIS